ncbi:MAG: GNAT family N-acetyltransferase [Parvularculaceae bacterium]|nr:GNAT family N-acetyltransferase [Parvularculaceae bacterium]
MADGSGDVLRTEASVAAVGAAAWRGLGGEANPFVSFDFLDALERSGSVGGDSGWAPIHAVLERNGTVTAAAPLYLKAHSYGEYVFDQGWADALQRAGGRYYPKLLAAAPFTPANGPRLLARQPADKNVLAAALVELARRLNVSSVHANFVEDADEPAFVAAGFLPRLGVQYHWFNRDYADFEAFLASLASRKRKTIRRERREAADSGLRIARLQGADIKEAHWDAFWTFYQDTGARKWGSPYLTRDFFSRVGATMAERIVLFLALDGERPIAGALNFLGADTIYGRYWGCVEHRPFLHFELCYHQAIEFAIEHKLQRVEAGAQGEHKLARGYEPVTTRSMHWIAHPGFRQAVADFLSRERAAALRETEELQEFTPYKKESS